MNDEIDWMENLQAQLNSHIRELWDNVLVPYIKDYENKEILNKISEDDYHIFYKFMIENNDICKYIL